VSEPDPTALYPALVLEHGNAPRRQGPLPGATHQARVSNPLCGDRVTLRLELAGDTVRTLRFETRGCLLAIASSSLLGEAVEGQPVAQARELARLVHALAVDPAAPPVPPGALELVRAVRQFPARVACVELPWKALLAALDGPAAGPSSAVG
jgi:nitrogen fixation protein NifU and related proteins